MVYIKVKSERLQMYWWINNEYNNAFRWILLEHSEMRRSSKGIRKICNPYKAMRQRQKISNSTNTFHSYKSLTKCSYTPWNNPCVGKANYVPARVSTSSLRPHFLFLNFFHCLLLSLGLGALQGHQQNWVDIFQFISTLKFSLEKSSANVLYSIMLILKTLQSN